MFLPVCFIILTEMKLLQQLRLICEKISYLLLSMRSDLKRCKNVTMSTTSYVVQTRWTIMNCKHCSTKTRFKHLKELADQLEVDESTIFESNQIDVILLHNIRPQVLLLRLKIYCSN